MPYGTPPTSPSTRAPASTGTLGSALLDGRDIRVVDCANVTARTDDHAGHYCRTERAERAILSQGTTLIALGGDHGISVPMMRALNAIAEDVTRVHVDAHLDWRDESFGVREGFRSPIQRASEMDVIGRIVQIGIRGVGSLTVTEVAEVRGSGAGIVTVNEMHTIGMDVVLYRIPDGEPHYLTIDADGLDPLVMPGVMSREPVGLTWRQARALVHGLVRKGRVLGMNPVEIAPGQDVTGVTLTHAERLICNFISACARAGHHDRG